MALGCKRMEEKILRERARQLIADRRLPKVLPSPERINERTGVPSMKIGAGAGRTCALCASVISAEEAAGACEYRYETGLTIRFHERCEDIWDQERQGLG